MSDIKSSPVSIIPGIISLLYGIQKISLLYHSVSLQGSHSVQLKHVVVSPAMDINCRLSL